MSRLKLAGPTRPPCENFLYLGRSYRLRLVDESIVPVKLVSGRFVMPKALAATGREHMIAWYCGNAVRWLSSKVEDFAARMENRQWMASHLHTGADRRIFLELGCSLKPFRQFYQTTVFRGGHY